MADIDVEGALENLQKWIIEDGKCVTKTLLLRQTSLNTRQAESVLNKFYEQHKDLSATFVVFGVKKSDDDGSNIRQSTICKQEKVDEIKKTFEKVISINIYSLHRNSATTIQTLLNADWSGQYQHPVVPLEDRLHIVCSLAVKGIKNRQKTNPKPVYSSFDIPEFMPKVKKQPKPLAKSIIVRNDQHSLKDAFAIAAMNQEEDDQMEVDEEEMIPETSKLPSPKKIVEDKSRKKLQDEKSELPSPKKIVEDKSGKKKKLQDEASKLPSPKKNPIFEDKSGKKKKLQDEDTDSTKGKKPVGKKGKNETEEPTKKQKKDNVFSIESEPKQAKSRKSPIKTENVEEEVSSKKRKSVVKETKADKPIKKENDDNMTQESIVKVKKTQDVTETYIDDEGMLVTQVVSKIVELDEPTHSKPSALKTKNSNSKPPQKLPTGQQSISSFFKKK